MKKIVLFLLFVVLVLPSCNDDDDGYSLGKFWIRIATVENDANSSNFFMRFDDNERVWVAQTRYWNYRPATGQRIIVNYTILNDKPEESGYAHDVILNNAYNVLTKNVIQITESERDSIGNDPVGISDIWLGRDYLNIKYYVNFYNRTHMLNLVWDKDMEYTDDKLHLFFRHNAFGDAQTYRGNGYVSFNLASLEDILPGESVEVVLHVNRFDNEDATYTFTYRFSEGENSSDKLFDEDDFDDGQEIESSVK